MKRGALVGCGFFARNHLHAWRALAGVEPARVEIVALCDRERDRAEALALEFGVPSVYADPAELLARERLDFADIVTGADSHAALVAQIAAAGINERFILLDLGVHLFDLARFFFGEAATLSAHTGRVKPDIRGEDVATALLKMTSGAQVVVEMSYASLLEQESFPQTLATLEGERGSAVLERDYRLVVTTDAGSRTVAASPPRHPWSRTPAEAVQDSVLALQRHWLECLDAQEEPETSGRDNLRTLELVFGAYEAAARGVTLAVGAPRFGELEADRG